MEVENEGTAGSIKLNDAGVVSPSTNKLYNNGGSLYWNGSALGSSSGATEINDLTDAKYENLSLFLGVGAGNVNSNAYGNTGIGFKTLYNNSNSSNTAIGRSAGYENTTGSQNVLIGPETNRLNQKGNNNTMIGYHAGLGSTLHDKSGSVFIGFQSGYNELTSNKLYIENSNSSTPLIWGDFALDEIKINGNFEVAGNISQNGFPIISDWDNGLSSELILVNASKNVGIGTVSSETLTKLHVKGDEGVLFQGTHNNGTILDLGAGTRFHFYTKKSAIRGGSVAGTQWDDSNIGVYSSAFGEGTIASGFHSTALGFHSIASGNSSTALGYRNTSSGNRSMAIGSESNSESFASFALGRFNIGGGDQASWVSTDPLFEIGTGTNDANRNNALTVFKNGRTIIKAESGVNPLKVQVGNSGKLSVFSNGGTSIGTDATAPSNGLLVSGDIRNTGNLLHASDLRFKSNIETIPNALKSLQRIRGVYYMWKKEEFPQRGFTNMKQIGVIAQEVEKEFPELVKTDEDGYKSVEYTKLSAILIEAVKEQQTMIKKLVKENIELRKIFAKNIDLEKDVAELKQVVTKLVQHEINVKVSKK